MDRYIINQARSLVEETLKNAFPHELSGPRHAGPEEEFPVVNARGFMADITPVFHELHLCGWMPKLDAVSGALIGVYKQNMEIGMDVGRGTMEIGFPHVGNLLDHVPVRKQTFALVDRLLEKHGFFRLKDYAIQPRTRPTPELWAPKGRGMFFRDFFDPRVHAQTLTASSQTHIDVTQAEALPALKAMLALAPVFIALNANSPVWKENADPGGLLAVRQHCWYGFTVNHGFWSNVLCGPPNQNGSTRVEQAPESFEELAAIISATPFIVRVSNNRIEGPGVSFETWYAASQCDLSSDELRRDAFLNHEATIWWDARLRTAYGTIEVRPSCQNRDSIATHALVLGLIENLKVTLDFVHKVKTYAQWRNLQSHAIAYGLHTDKMPRIAHQVIWIAEEGLKRRGMGEEILLSPLKIRVQRSTSPAHTKLAIFKESGIDALVDHLLG
ncbi:MAG: hypothetical protein UY76_C0045G0005 [Candidatus Uhrbacteria bacterium GW2011_GWA2_52_8d]|uniref:glutamate--cysteine ligase n=1 Tax=Candidatus Uhrbacteria bacterium GW2011_GWA2_52_8d TaxID=1618979 RepID=A0A0G1XMA9_9BACT|nr:MAG: hypothetical protein UY76_C0045G0005 [Candidatus Uhrbacteria bacterium GW2011_GWA2_52_8d]